MLLTFTIKKNQCSAHIHKCTYFWLQWLFNALPSEKLKNMIPVSNPAREDSSRRRVVLEKFHSKRTEINTNVFVLVNVLIKRNKCGQLYRNNNHSCQPRGKQTNHCSTLCTLSRLNQSICSWNTDAVSDVSLILYYYDSSLRSDCMIIGL